MPWVRDAFDANVTEVSATGWGRLRNSQNCRVEVWLAYRTQITVGMGNTWVMPRVYEDGNLQSTGLLSVFGANYESLGFCTVTSLHGW